MTVVFKENMPTLYIPFGQGALQVGLCFNGDKVGIMVGRVDPPVGFGNEVPPGEVHADFVISFSNKEATARFRRWLDTVDGLLDERSNKTESEKASGEETVERSR